MEKTSINILIVMIVAVANIGFATPSMLCAVTQEIATGEKPIVRTVVEPFSVNAGRPETREVNAELNIYCQAVIYEANLGNIYCEFKTGQNENAHLLTKAFAAAMPVNTGLKGYLSFGLPYNSSTKPELNGNYVLICMQN